MSGVPALHVRNVPDELYEKLRARAEREGRSINGEAIAVLEEALARPSPSEVRALMGRMFRRRRPGSGGFLHRFTPESRAVVARAQREARSLHHERVGTEHLAVGLFGDAAGLACEILDSLGISVDDVRARIPEGTSEAASGQLPFEPETKRVLELALREALALGQSQIGTEHLLLGLLRDEDAPGGALLRERGADYAPVRSAIAAAAGPPDAFVEWGPAGGASWEYRVAEISGLLEEALDDLARELPGWELVSLTGQAPELRAILKRRAA